jgi:hypothetical protein
MTTSAGTNPSIPPDQSKAPHLDFGQWKSALLRGWNRFYRFFADRIDGWFEFIGQMIAALASLVGSRRQLALATSLACIFGGLGLAIARGESVWGAFWMALGGFILGAILPVPNKKN